MDLSTRTMILLLCSGEKAICLGSSSHYIIVMHPLWPQRSQK